MSKEFFIGRKNAAVYQYRRVKLNWLLAWWFERKLNILDAIERGQIIEGYKNEV